MITIPNSGYTKHQREMLSEALLVAGNFICENSPAKNRGCQACPFQYRRLCKDLQLASDYLKSKNS